MTRRFSLGNVVTQLCAGPATWPASSRARPAPGGSTGRVHAPTARTAAEMKIRERMTCLLYLQRTAFADRSWARGNPLRDRNEPPDTMRADEPEVNGRQRAAASKGSAKKRSKRRATTRLQAPGGRGRSLR